MKQFWQKFSTRIDAMSLRERALIFLMAAVILVVLVNTLLLDPQFARQKQLSQKITTGQTQIAAVQSDIQQKIRGRRDNPDAALRQQLQRLQQQSSQLRGALQETRKALVAPERMPALLEAILRHDGRLQLVSLTTLPVADLTEHAPAESKAADAKTANVKAAGTAVAGAISGTASTYRHGVEITVTGTYPDMMHYMAQLEAMPWQLYWGKAKLQVESWPQARLTLTVFTLSLDKKWINL
ncbi:MAG: MSHA biogenesis protein MshJ [Gallionellales bacterium RBG_16_56_9]|nr:MAG: MSHA biogenesis protein MshJ [Gallionellales bacterium RBG_16_56_9]